MVSHSRPGNILNNPRQIAASCIHAVCEQGQSLDEALAEHESTLSGSDLSQCRALSYGGVRWYLGYRDYLDRQLKKPFKPKDRILYAVLVSALDQLDHSRHPAHAVVNEAVALARAFKRQWASGLVNALLRKHIRGDRQRPLDIAPESWHRACYPAWMVEQFEQAWPEHVDQVLAAMQAEPPLTLRVNCQRSGVQDYLGVLADAQIEAAPCSDANCGINIRRPVAVDRLPGFASALVSVQDESAQLAVEMLDLHPGQRVLDACAAPGGKSLHILEREPAVQSLDLLDLPQRLPRLRDNIQRAGLSANIIAGDLLKYPEWWNGAQYDRILLDAPCTGSGVIRRHPDIKFRRQPENGLKFAANQIELIRHAWHLLKPGGRLLYTTCSILPAENEDCIAAFIRTTQAACALPVMEKAGLRTEHGRQRLPGIYPGDGFFYALLEKR